MMAWCRSPKTAVKTGELSANSVHLMFPSMDTSMTSRPTCMTKTRCTLPSTTTSVATSNLTSSNQLTAAKPGTTINGDLPERGSVYALKQDHENPRPALLRNRVRLLYHGRRRPEMDQAGWPAHDRDSGHRDSTNRKRSWSWLRLVVAFTSSTTIHRCGRSMKSCLKKTRSCRSRRD